jgi:putative sterol carrier protein/putative NADPH-quinone reductase
MDQHILIPKGGIMKILALNSSPRGDGQSKTGIMLNSLVEGMREAGAEVEVVSLSKKTIKPCAGCFSCWTKTPGKCIYKDDMTRELFPRWLKSDLVVYASPLYHYTVNSGMKAFIERTLPVFEPFFIPSEGRTYHPLRSRAPKVAMLSVAGFPEDSVFDPLSSWVNYIFGSNSVYKNTLVAEIYRPMSEALTVPYYKDIAKDVLSATQAAGQELVASLSISKETMAKITQPMASSPEKFLELGNLMWKTCIAEGVTPKAFDDKGLVPRADSARSFLALMQVAFNADAAGATDARLQFNFSGEIEDACYLSIHKGTITGAIGTVDQADLTVNAPFEIWMDIMTKKADGQQLFMEQKYTVEGDLALLMQMDHLFGQK